MPTVFAIALLSFSAYAHQAPLSCDKKRLMMRRAPREHLPAATSVRVPRTLAHPDELGEQCYDNLLATVYAAPGTRQPVTRSFREAAIIFAFTWRSENRTVRRVW